MSAGMAGANTEAIRGFHALLTETRMESISEALNAEDAGKFSDCYIRMARKVITHHGGPLNKALEKTHSLVTDLSDDVFIGSANSLSAWAISYRAADFIQDFYLDMVHTLFQKLKAGVAIDKVLAHTLGAACGDLVPYTNAAISTIICELLTGADMWKGLVNTPLKTALVPVAATFLELPSPVSSMVDMRSTVDAAVTACLTAVLVPITDGATKKLLAKDALIAELGGDAAAAK